MRRCSVVAILMLCCVHALAAVAMAAVAPGTPGADSLALARQLLAQAEQRRTAGPLGDGGTTQLSERAVALAERFGAREPDLLVRSHAFAALVHIDLTQPDSALAHVHRALDVTATQAAPDDSLLATLHLREGQAYRIREDYPAAIRSLHLARALLVPRRGPKTATLVSIGAELGRTFTYLSEFDSARVELEQAARIAAEDSAASTARLESVLATLATLERKVGNYARAVDLAAQVCNLYIARMGEHGADLSGPQSSLAYALVALGDYERARALLERVLERQAAVLPATHLAMVQNRMTLAMACTKLGDLEPARAQFRIVDSLVAAGGVKDRALLVFGAAVRTGYEMRAGRYREARSLLLTAARANPPALSSRLDLITRLYETLRDPGDRAFADSLGREVDRLADSTQIERLKNWPFLLMDRSDAEARLGQEAIAWAHAMEAERLASGGFRWEIEALSDRGALVLDEGEADPSQALVRLAHADRAAEVQLAWEAVVRRRGAVRSVVEARRGAFAPADTAVQAAFTRWTEASRRHARALVSGEFDSGEAGARASFEASRMAVETAESRYAQLASAQGHSSAAPTLASVRASLPARSVLVAFVRTQSGFDAAQLSAFVARAGDDSIRLVRLGAEDALAAAIEPWTQRLAAPPSPGRASARTAESAARSAGEIVRQRAWDPMQEAIGGAQDVFVVGSGPLRDLPWLALPLPRGRYLAESDVRVHVFTAERELVRASAARATTGLLAVGDPDFEAPPLAGGALLARRRLPGACVPANARLLPLPGARAETHAVVTEWSRDPEHGPAQSLLGTEATEANFKALAPGRSSIHLATHGLVTRDTCVAATIATRGVGGVSELAGGARAQAKPAQPKPRAATPWIDRDTYLALAGANRTPGAEGDENDGWLTAPEVVTLDLRGTHRVVLSACQSGVADRWTQEAVSGMRRAFHLAGARCVIASRWPIADEWTRVWMEAFYASHSPSAAGALQDAARAVIQQRRARGLGTHPFYWAAFTASGD